jgi:hypothetical protein
MGSVSLTLAILGQMKYDKGEIQHGVSLVHVSIITNFIGFFITVVGVVVLVSVMVASTSS